jgi:O-antigen/teichoic acid export membrane protein
MSALKKLAGETAVYGLSSILGRLFNYVLMTPYLTRVFKDNEYGSVTFLYGYAALLAVFFSYRLETAFFRYGADAANRERVFGTAFLSVLGSSALLGGGLLIGSSWLADSPLFQLPNGQLYIVTFVWIVVFDALSALPFALLRLENRPMVFAKVKFLNLVVNIISVVFLLECLPLLWSGYRAENRVWYVFLGNLVASFATFLALLPYILRSKLVFDKVLWRQMIGYSMPLLVVSVAFSINEVLDRVLLPYLLPGTRAENMAQTGIYSAAYRLAILMNLFNQAFNYAAEPFFFRNADRSDAKAMYADVAQAFSLVGAVVFLGIMLYLDLVQYLLGSNFRSGLAVVPFLIFANVFQGLYNNFSVWYKLTNKTGVGAWIAIVGALLTVLLNIWWIPLWGFMGSAYATLVVYAFLAVATYIPGQRYYPVPYKTGRIGLYLLGALGVYMVSVVIRPYIGEQLVAILLANTVLLCAYMGGIVWLEYPIVKRLVGNRR